MTSPSIVPTLPGEPSLISPRRSALPNLSLPPKSAMKPAARVRLRCVGVQPRLIQLVELEPADCRYPYGGDKDGEEITFCGHPRQPGAPAIARRMPAWRAVPRLRPPVPQAPSC